VTLFLRNTANAQHAKLSDIFSGPGTQNGKLPAAMTVLIFATK